MLLCIYDKISLDGLFAFHVLCYVLGYHGNNSRVMGRDYRVIRKLYSEYMGTWDSPGSLTCCLQAWVTNTCSMECSTFWSKCGENSYSISLSAAFIVGFENDVYNIHEAVGFQRVCVSLSGDLDDTNASITVTSSTDGATAEGDSL